MEEEEEEEEEEEVVEDEEGPTRRARRGLEKSCDCGWDCGTGVEAEE